MHPNIDFTRSALKETPFQKLFDDLDWANTDLGPRETWPRELKQMVRLIMLHTDPMVIYVEPHYSIIYNEACAPLIGDNHPRMLGSNAADSFPEFWAYFDHIISELRVTGMAARGEATMLLLERHGFTEETYFDWKLTPLIDDHGAMFGTLSQPSEMTFEIIGSRRRHVTQVLSQSMLSCDNLDELFTRAIQALADNGRDVPFAVLYSVDHKGTTPTTGQRSGYRCHLRGSIGLPANHRLQEKSIHISSQSQGFAPAILEAMRTRTIQVLETNDIIREVVKGVEWQGFAEESKSFAVVPMVTGSVVGAVLVLGVNPYRRCNQRYHDFLQLVAEIMAPQIAKLQLAEELKERSETARRALQDFEKSETRFTRLATRSSIGLILSDPSGQLVYANDAWYDFTGLERGEMESRPWIQTVHPDDVSMVEEWWHRLTVLKEKGQFQVRSKVPFRSGHMSSPHRTGICAVYADLAADGSVESVMGLIVDISEQKWTENQLLQRSRELVESEAQYRQFAEHAPVGVLRTDADGRILFSNETWRTFYDFATDELAGIQPWLEHAHAEDVDKARQYFTDLCEGGGPRAVEFRLKRKFYLSEGDRLIENDSWVLATGFAERNSDGSIAHLDFWVTDISPQKMAAKILTDRMEEAIRNRTQQERFIDMISHEIRNPLSAVLHCGEEIVDSMKQCLAIMDEPHVAGRSGETRNIRRSRIRHLIENALDAGNTTMYCVQHQKQIVDDVLTLSKLDSDLLVVSPVPVQPMSLMQSLSKIFEPEMRSSDIGLCVVEDESLARHEMSWLLLDPNRFLQIVINLVTNAIKFTRTSSTRRITLTVAVVDDESPRLPGIDYVPRRYRPPMQRTSSTMEQLSPRSKDYYLCVSVSDTGQGLTSEEKKLLFNRFAQASPKTHVEYGGSGLGLFISRQITEMLGGEIGVGTSPEGGCVFAFYAATRRMEAPAVKTPRSSRHNSSLNTSPSKEASTPSRVVAVRSHATASELDPDSVVVAKRARRRKILVVEDNLINQKVLCKQLRNRGFLVETANHGQEALDALERSQALIEGKYFDVVLCDIEMPVMDGIECVKNVRELEENGDLPGHVPIVGVTANVRSKQVDAAIEAGMDGVTTKPYRIDDLIAHIDRLCAPGEQESVL